MPFTSVFTEDFNMSCSTYLELRSLSPSSDDITVLAIGEHFRLGKAIDAPAEVIFSEVIITSEHNIMMDEILVSCFNDGCKLKQKSKNEDKCYRNKSLIYFQQSG